MASPFARFAARMDAATVTVMGEPVLINGESSSAVESQFVAEMGPLIGDGLSLVVFSTTLKPRKGDEVIWREKTYKVTRQQLFNGKPQIWIE
ncbi:ATP-binding protein [Buttiauxella selenatireducens]|uniref:ATP-binding protein n=1 Tax=Buttiauxella selenatireducens TaxID=3073902 RepID=A0ABY9SEP1_9ENTR|nr:ATP-binding protein [Buttiauxella sp. R73]WMY75413.1 ATP-binding protein [Buttiauxella sp. R73]